MTTRIGSPETNTPSEVQHPEAHTSLSSLASLSSPLPTTTPALVGRGDLRLAAQSSEALRQGSAAFLAPDFKGLQTCGEPIHPGLPVPLYMSRVGIFYFGGLGACGSVSACPVCSWRVMRKRQRHLMDCYRTVSALGGSTLVFHLTAGYPGSMRVAEQRERLQAAYARFSSGNNSLGGRTGKKARVLGSFRSLEFKYDGQTARWNPHFHGAIFFTGDVPPEFSVWLTGRWSGSLEAVGLRGGEDTRPEEAGEESLPYICKPIWTDETEKTGDRLTPFQLLARAAGTGESRWISAYQEYANAMKGKRTTLFSRGLAEELGLAASKH